jgi:MoaA/NifB/PqqE/SkfB family radical SAM enzyme
MLDRVVDWLKQRTRGRPFEAFQIEVTSRCVTRCVMCPRVALADEWHEMDLSWETFQRIARAFDLTQHVHLQGWGEPLLHPRLFEMIGLAKRAGCRVGLTTNGMGLDQDTGRRLLNLNVDLIAISIAGATRRTHESIRVGSDFPVILENVRRLLTLRAEEETKRPKVEFSYLMTKSNMAELPEAVELAASLGVDELYAINLDYVVAPEHDELKAFACPSPLSEAFVRIVDGACERARRIGLKFRSYPLDLEEVAVCEANPTSILFISCDGWVSPCPYMGLAGRTEIPRRFEGQSLAVSRLRFGNITEQELVEIWKNPAYRAFRRQFEARYNEAMALTIGVETSSGDAYQPGLLSPPEPCLTCYKLYGV